MAGQPLAASASMNADVVVLGGGFAGMSAASHLAQRGAQTVLVEKKPFLGGRVYSVRDRCGDWIDNGQHALMGCYRETLKLLDMWGTADGVQFQDDLQVPYRSAKGWRDALACPHWPGPLHLLAGMLRMSSLTWRDKLAAMRFGLELRRKGGVHESETLGAFCERLGQTPALRQRLWDSIALSALNETPEQADAELFKTVMQQAFLGGAKDSRMGLPVIPWHELHGERFIQFLQARKGRVILRNAVRRLETAGNRIAAVHLASGERIACEACVSALPFASLRTLLDASNLSERIDIPDLGASPIVNVYLWYDKAFTTEKFACLLDATFEWAFHRSNFMKAGGHSGFCVSLTVSAGRRLQERSRAQLIEAAKEDIQKTYPESDGAQPNHASVFWEPQATFSATPQNARRRPGPKTAIANFVLAGDWIATGLPATIEGAALSGVRALDGLKA
ncbi:MAG: hydroxysqualene dehydroxylase HpnE [Candidatus Omnitrophota bacterium]